MRLQKYIAACGVASRRKAEEMIINGSVKVNGHPAQIGMNVIPGKDSVTLNDVQLIIPHGKVYIALNKPRGYVTTMSDELGRKCITELIQDVDARVFPVGRLDKNSEGLLLLTDDGDFANALMHPSRHVPKIYHVSVRPAINESQLTKIETGIELDGVMTAPAKAVVLHQYQDRSTVEITLYEGRNREIRRMCESLGLEVARLQRVGIGTIKLGGLKPGTWRELDDKEITALQRAVGFIENDRKKVGQRHDRN